MPWEQGTNSKLTLQLDVIEQNDIWFLRSQFFVHVSDMLLIHVYCITVVNNIRLELQPVGDTDFLSHGPKICVALIL